MFSFTRKLIFWKKKKILDIFPTVLALPKNYFFILVTFSVEHQQPRLRFRLLKKFRLHQFFLSESLIWSPLLLLGHLLGDEGGRSSSYSSFSECTQKKILLWKTHQWIFFLLYKTHQWLLFIVIILSCIKITSDYSLLYKTHQWLFFIV